MQYFWLDTVWKSAPRLRPGRLYGDGMWEGPGSRPKYLPYIILGPFREIWEYVREISGNYRWTKCAGVWEPCYRSLWYSSTGHERCGMCCNQYPTFIALTQLALKITRWSLPFRCVWINSNTCHYQNISLSGFQSVVLGDLNLLPLSLKDGSIYECTTLVKNEMNSLLMMSMGFYYSCYTSKLCLCKGEALNHMCALKCERCAT